MDKQSLKIIKANIDLARRDKAGRRIIAVISGSGVDRENWDARLQQNRELLFGPEARVLSLVEEINDKTREGNFLGTLLAFRRIREYCAQHNWSYTDTVTLIGMIFGRGERMSPFTQIEGNRKPAIVVNSGYRESSPRLPLMAIEESLLYFTPVARYLEAGGFRGVLDKWGDETEIPSLPLYNHLQDNDRFRGDDIIKFVSAMRIEGELACQKDWVVFDAQDRMLAQLARDRRERLEPRLAALGVRPGADGIYTAGVSLGPVALSYEVLEIAAELFSEEVLRPGVYIDFDPYFMMAITMPPEPAAWEAQVATEAALQELVAMVPDFFSKVQNIKVRFQQRYGRPLSIRVCDLGSDVYWADIGQHEAMARKYLSLLEDSPEGMIACYLEGLPATRDARGNLILDSLIDPGVEVSHSVILGSYLTGRGVVRGCVVKDSQLHNPLLEGAFAVLSRRSGERLILPPGSGLYKSLGKADLVLAEGQRSGTLLTAEGAVQLVVAMDTDLRRRAETYDCPILGNPLSFRDAFDKMVGVGMEELKRRRQDYLASFTQ